MFITGPDVIKTVTHEEVTKEELGGALTHNRQSGVAHFAANTDRECLCLIRELLSFLPSNNLEIRRRSLRKPDPVGPSRRGVGQHRPRLRPTSRTTSRSIINSVADENYFFEVQAHFAQNIVVGFARLHGRPVGIVANQPRVLAGCLDIDASVKAARFVRFCDASTSR